MFASLWLCLGLLLVAPLAQGRPSWRTGILDRKGVELSLPRPVHVPNQLLQAQYAVKKFIQGANEDALEHLAVMKQMQMQLFRQQFYNNLKKRLFRLDVLKPRPNWQLKPCRGSILNCFILPKKSYLSHPVYSKVLPITYHQNFCNHLPQNTYLFQECQRRALLLYTHAIVIPTTKTYPVTTADNTDKSFDSQNHLTNEEQAGKKIELVTLPSKMYDLDKTSATTKFDKSQKLDGQKTALQLENEILGLKDIENIETFTKPPSTSLQTESNTFKTDTVSGSVTHTEFANARNGPESSTPSDYRYGPTTDSVTVNFLTTPPYDMEINVEGRFGQLYPDSSSTSSSGTETKELNQDHANLDEEFYSTSMYSETKIITSPVSHASDLTPISSGKMKEDSEIRPEPTENVKKLYNEAREEVNSFPSESASPYALLNPTSDQNEYVTTEQTQTELPLLAREEGQDFKPLMKEVFSQTDSMDTTSILERETPFAETAPIPSTPLPKLMNEDRYSEATTLTENPNQAHILEILVAETTPVHITEEEPKIQSHSVQPEVSHHQMTTEENERIYLESTFTSTSEGTDITLEAGGPDPRQETIEGRENVQYSLEEATLETTDSEIKNDLGIVQTSPSYTKEYIITTDSIVHKPYLDVQDKLLDRSILYSSQRGNYNNDAEPIVTTPEDVKERNDLDRNVDGPLDKIPQFFEESTLDPALNVIDKELRSFDELMVATEYNESNNDSTEVPLDRNVPTEYISSGSPIFSSSTNNIRTDINQNNSDDILKFTSEIEPTSVDTPTIEEGLPSAILENTTNQDSLMLGTKDENNFIVHREKRSSEDKVPGNMEGVSLNGGNASHVYISPTEYASTILEILPVIREGYKNNAFSDEDKKAIRSIFGEMRTLMDEGSLKQIEESATDLLMGDETSRMEDMDEYYDYESSDSEEGDVAEKERRLKRSKTNQKLTSFVANIPKSSQKQFRKMFSSLRKDSKSRNIRSSGPQPVSEAAAILALLAENGEGVQLDRGDDEDDDEYEYYEDEDEDEDSSDEYSYEEEYDDNPSFTELIKLARKHRQRKAMQ